MSKEHNLFNSKFVLILSNYCPTGYLFCPSEVFCGNQNMKKYFRILPVAFLALLVLQAGVVFAKPPRTGQLYYNGEVVRTLVPSGKPLQKEGSDPLYVFPNPEGEGTLQYSVTQYTPGDKEYRGGHWAVWLVSWNVEPRVLTSYDEVAEAIDLGDISVTRSPENDVLCPVLNGKSMW